MKFVDSYRKILLNKMKLTHVLGNVWVYSLFGLSWLSWVVMLGGVAGMQVRVKPTWVDQALVAPAFTD